MKDGELPLGKDEKRASIQPGNQVPQRSVIES